jgi:hypothetical protein
MLAKWLSALIAVANPLAILAKVSLDLGKAAAYIFIEFLVLNLL